MEFAKQNLFKSVARSVFAIAFVVVALFLFSACGQTSMYNIDFNGGEITYNGNKGMVDKATWEKCENEEGFDAVYKLTGTVPANKFVNDQIYGGLAKNVVLIKFTSNTVTKVSYDKETGKGFYNILNKGTENEKEKHASFSSADGEVAKTTYFFYQQVDDTVRTLTMNISFDGTKEHEAVYKFIIDPANYTLTETTSATTK